MFETRGKVVLVSLLLLLLTSGIIFPVKAEFDLLYEYQKRQPPTKYCGPNLANSLSLFCNGFYNTMFKKSVQETDLDDYSYYDDAAYPFRSRETARSMLARLGYNGRFRRITRGIHDECCVKPCTVDELRSYCARN